jgi:hypothetical protein
MAFSYLSFFICLMMCKFKTIVRLLKLTAYDLTLINCKFGPHNTLIMIYPQSFESKTGFERIRELISDYCSGASGRELADSLSFSSSFELLKEAIDETWEMQQL